MSNPHYDDANDVRIAEIAVAFEPVPFRMPLKFGGRVVDQTQLINVAVRVERRDGSSATGHGSMPVGNVWAWPSDTVEAAAAERAMCRFADQLASGDWVSRDWGDPIAIMHAAIGRYDELAAAIQTELGLAEPLPKLAQLVAASPLDAAVHDAYGRAHGRSSFDVLGPAFIRHDLSHYLDERFAGEFLDAIATATPSPTMPLYHLVGALDPLTSEDVAERPDDLLPVTLGEWIAADGLTHLKIKLSGSDLDWDLQRVLAIDAVAESHSRPDQPGWWYSADFNEKCPSAAALVDWLDRLKAASPRAYDRVQYLEQPTSRDLHADSQSPMHEAAARKPVVIDESLVSYEALRRAMELGYSGVALKACKGQTEALLAAAAARKFGLFLCVQDLTCPGASFLHSASLAAHLPDVTAIEGNGRQYCPAPNAAWAPRYPGMFAIDAGVVHTGELDGVGLGFAE